MATDAAKAASPPNLEDHLRSILPFNTRPELGTSVLPAIIDSLADIAKLLRNAHHVSLAGTANLFGDDQLNVDVLAENAIRAAISACPAVVAASSEEDPVERSARAGGGVVEASSASEQYTVAFDPLDGSSIIAPNWTVGTIVGIWDGRTALRQAPAERQVAAVLGIYGPRTTALVAVRLPGAAAACFEIGLVEDGSKGWEIIRPIVRLSSPPFKTRYFAPANLRAAGQDERYMGLIAHYVQASYTLRYSGGLVPDLVHALVKGHGIYISPVTPTSTAKLRRLFELYPVALIIECAGGRAIDPADGKDILERALDNLNERAGLICGTADEVDFAWNALSR